MDSSAADLSRGGKHADAVSERRPEAAGETGSTNPEAERPDDDEEDEEEEETKSEQEVSGDETRTNKKLCFVEIKTRYLTTSLLSFGKLLTETFDCFLTPTVIHR